MPQIDRIEMLALFDFLDFKKHDLHNKGVLNGKPRTYFHMFMIGVADDFKVRNVSSAMIEMGENLGKIGLLSSLCRAYRSNQPACICQQA